MEQAGIILYTSVQSIDTCTSYEYNEVEQFKQLKEQWGSGNNTLEYIS